MSQELEPAGWGDDRFAASSNAVKAVVAVMAQRWPGKATSIGAWSNAYIEVMCGQRPGEKPLLTPDEIKTVAREVMRDWRSPSLFPLPGTFGKIVDEYLGGKRQSAKAEYLGGKRQTLMDAAMAAGKMFRRWSYVYERHPDDDRYYRATRPNGELMSMQNGDPLMVYHWCNAEHFRTAYDDAMRALTGDPDAQRAVEALVATVAPWDPSSEPLRPARGFAAIGELTPHHVPGGPGEHAAANLAEPDKAVTAG